MKNNAFIQNDVPETREEESLSGLVKTGILAKVGRHLKTYIYIAGLAGIGLMANSCVLGYVATEPVYVETSRPPQPSNLHIWIDGDWVYSNQSHGYVRNTGYWERPRQNSVYVSGRWQSTPQGKHWEKGRWQKNGNQGRNNNRNDNRR
jgi:hypothetical protein